MNFDLDYHKSQNTLHVGCEKPRAYYIPFDSDAEAAAAGDRRPPPADSCRFAENGTSDIIPIPPK